MTDFPGRLDAYPRARVTFEQTPLERLPNLESDIGNPQIFAKRDYAQPLAFGGNKVRQLEFYFGDALEKGADTVLITGAVQSNFCRLCAAFAARLGMECHVQLEERVPKGDPIYRTSGNVLVERLLGATVHSFPDGEDEAGADARLEQLASDLRSGGRTPYVIHLSPGHPPLGALGYVVAARELVAQMAAMSVDPGAIFLPSGSGATHAGLLFGLRALGVAAEVHGICVRREARIQRSRILTRCDEIAALLGIRSPVTEADVLVTDEFLAPGYGLMNEPTLEAIRIGASREALMLDPVYSGKAMAALLKHAPSADADRPLVFLHTGGTPGIFAYGDALAGGGGR